MKKYLNEIKRILNNITININVYLFDQNETKRYKACVDINTDIRILNNLINNDLVELAQSINPELKFENNVYSFNDDLNYPESITNQIKSLIDLLVNL